MHAYIYMYIHVAIHGNIYTHMYTGVMNIRIPLPSVSHRGIVPRIKRIVGAIECPASSKQAFLRLHVAYMVYT